MLDYLRKDAHKILIPRVFNFIVGTVILLLIGKSWGASGSGEYSVILTFFVLSSQMAIFGLDSLLLHHVGEGKLSKTFFKTMSSFHIFLVGPIIFFIFYLFKDSLKFSFISDTEILLLLCAYICNVALVLFSFYKLSRKEFNLYLTSVVLKPFLQLALLLITVYTSYKFSILTIVAYPMILTFVVHFFYIFKLLRFKFDRDFFSKWIEIISQAKWIYFSSIIFLLNSKGIILITNKYGTIENVGVLFIALSALDIISYISNSFGDITQIDMAALPRSEKFSKFRKDYRHILLVNFICAMASIPFVYTLLPLINEEFANSFYIYIIILPSYVLISSSKMMSVYFISLKKAHYNTISVFITLLIILFSALIFVKHYGVFGAGIAVSIGYFSSSFIDFILIAKEDGFYKMLTIFYTSKES